MMLWSRLMGNWTVPSGSSSSRASRSASSSSWSLLPLMRIRWDGRAGFVEHVDEVTMIKCEGRGGPKQWVLQSVRIV